APRWGTPPDAGRGTASAYGLSAARRALLHDQGRTTAGRRYDPAYGPAGLGPPSLPGWVHRGRESTGLRPWGVPAPPAWRTRAAPGRGGGRVQPGPWRRASAALQGGGRVARWGSAHGCSRHGEPSGSVLGSPQPVGEVPKALSSLTQYRRVVGVASRDGVTV